MQELVDISLELQIRVIPLFEALKGSKCKVFSAPTDVVFYDEHKDEKRVVIPDLFVTCHSNQFTENEFVSPP